MSHNDTASAEEPARCRRPVSASAELYIVTYMKQKVKDPMKIAAWQTALPPERLSISEC